MNDLKDAVEYLKLKPKGRLNNPDVLLALAKKLGIKTERRVRGRLLSMKGRVWVKTIQAEIIEKAQLKRSNEAKKEAKVLKALNLNSNEPSFKTKKKKTYELLDKIKTYESYLVKIDNPENELRVIHTEFMNTLEEKNFSERLVFLVVLFKEIEGNKIRQVSVRRNKYEEFEDFEEFINKLISGDIQGSDPINEDEYELIGDTFIINTWRTLSGFGDEKCMFWENELIEGKGNCGDKCLEFVGAKLPPKAKIKDLNVMVKYIQDNNLKVRVVKNNPSFDCVVFKDEIKNAPFVKEEIKHFNKKQVEIKKAYLQNNFTFNYKVISECDGFTHTIIYCENGKHFGVAKNNTMTLKPNVFIDLYERSVGNDEVGLLYSYKDLSFYNITTYETNKDTKLLYVFYDLETIINWKKSNCMEAYSLSICYLDEEQLTQLEKYDKANNKEECENMRMKYATTFIGYDCVEKFLMWIVKNQADTKMKFIGFNNSNFDNFFILDALMRGSGMNDLYHNLKETDVFFSGSSLNNFTINNRHSFFDLRKHLVGSLANNCKSWGVNCCSKLSFNHNEAQSLYDKDPRLLIDFCYESDTLKKYNEFDTISVAVILKKYMNELNSIPCVKNVIDKLGSGKTLRNNNEINSVVGIGTIGSLIYKVFSEECKQNEITFDKLDKFKYDELQRCKIAGRVEMFCGKQSVKEKCASVDVCSLYPYVLAVKDVYYPSGKIIEVNSFQGFETLGFYWITFNQSSLKDKNLPNIYAYKTGIKNMWDYEGEIKQYLLSNTIIKMLDDFGVEYQFDSPVDYAGFVFSEKHKSCDMFRFLLEIMKKKNEQDALKSNPAKKHLYNSALRETLKLLMNAISGKVIEGLHTEQTEVLDSAELALLFNKVANSEEESDKKKCIKSINMVNCYGGKLVVQYEVFDKYKLHQQRPIYLGVLLYDYAKDYMYREAYSKIGLKKLLYTDTDSCKSRYVDFLEWQKEASKTIVPHWEEVEEYDERYSYHSIYNEHDKVFGSFEDEFEDYEGEEYHFFCLEKKCWLYKYGDKVDYRFKGLNDRAIHMDMTTPPIWVNEIKRTNKQTGEREVGYSINQDFAMEINNYNQAHSSDCLKGQKAYDLYNTLYNEGGAYVLTSSFRKHTGNTAQALDSEGEIDYGKLNNLTNKVQLCYMMKKIQI